MPRKVAQQVFFQVLRVLPAYAPEGRSFRRWVSKVAHNAAEDHWRRTRRSERTAPDQVDRWLEAAQQETPLWGEAGVVHELLDELSLTERQVLVLLYRWELTPREVGIALDR